MESQARLEAAGLAKRTLEEAKENAEREAREIIARSDSAGYPRLRERSHDFCGSFQMTP
ncbi:MAG: hypothetical protein U0231_03330 [Nitrospiraceae bacterium]